MRPRADWCERSGRGDPGPDGAKNAAQDRRCQRERSAQPGAQPCSRATRFQHELHSLPLSNAGFRTDFHRMLRELFKEA
jgi:hypothetical protein